MLLGLISCSETMIWNKGYRFKLQSVQVENLGVLGVRFDKITNNRVRKLCGVKKSVNESISKWSGNLERMNDNQRGRIF